MKIYFFIAVLFLPFRANTQPAIEVADLTMRIQGFAGIQEESVYYCFAAGDEIIFHFQTEKGKLLKELEISEYPNHSRYKEFKVKNVSGKRLKVVDKGVYQFRFYNSALTSRICKVKIERIPAHDTLVNYPTNVQWELQYDTSYSTYHKNVIIGYDTTYRTVTELELAKRDTIVETIVDRKERVHSYFNENPSRSVVPVTLPITQSSAIRKEKLISWAYWIGVGPEAQEAWKKDREKVAEAAAGLAGAMFSPLASFAVGAIATFTQPRVGDNVHFQFIADYGNAQAFLNRQAYSRFDFGNGVTAFGKNTSLLQGQFFIGLYNDNDMQGIDVNLKIAVVKLVEIFEYRKYQEPVIKPITERKMFSDPIVVRRRVPLCTN